MTRPGISAAPWIALLSASLVLYLAACGGGSAEPAEPAVAGEPAMAAESVEPAVAATPAEDDSAAGPAVPTGNPELLSEWGQLEVSNGRLLLADGVVPYALNTALFSDYAHKLRTVRLPDGSEPAVYNADDVFDFPIGTVITKTFYFPRADGPVADAPRVAKLEPAADVLAHPLDLASVRLIETRILVHRPDGWAALPYVWNDDQTEATLERVGDLIMLTLVDEGADGAEAETRFPYVVPDVNQCANCHAVNHTTGLIQPIGPKARHLNRNVELGDGVVSQLAHWQEQGLLPANAIVADAPRSALWGDESVSLDLQARSYLDVNCAHCHNSVGPADTSGLFLEPTTILGPALGICKLPIAAGTGTGGRLVGIHPGEPDLSIFVHRMQTTDPSAMMPELGRSLPHTEGVDLISRWITDLDGGC